MEDLRFNEHDEGEYKFTHKQSGKSICIDGFYKNPNKKLDENDLLIIAIQRHHHLPSRQYEDIIWRRRQDEKTRLIDEYKSKNLFAESEKDKYDYIILLFYGYIYIF